MTLLADIADTVNIYFLMFFIIAIIAYNRNATFQSFVKNIYKNYLSFANVLPLFVYFSIFFNNFLNLISILVTKISKFFKKK
jgi:hypothetical protein